jgi:hypothetical protein
MEPTEFREQKEPLMLEQQQGRRAWNAKVTQLLIHDCGHSKASRVKKVFV